MGEDYDQGQQDFEEEQFETEEKTADEIRQEMASKIIKAAKMLKKRKKLEQGGDDSQEDDEDVTDILQSKLVSPPFDPS